MVYAIYSAEVDHDGKFLIFLTNWGYLFWVAYLLSATVMVTIRLIRNSTFSCIARFVRKQPVVPPEERDFDNWQHHGGRHGRINCCERLTWFLFIVAAEAAALICILFWVTLYNFPGATSVFSIHPHLLSALVALFDLWVSGTPVYLLHFVYMQLFGSTYVCFTGIYYALNGTGLNGSRAIYPILDYENNTGIAVGLSVSMALLGTVVLHMLFLAQYLCRMKITSYLQLKYKQRYRSTVGSIVDQDGLGRSSSASASPFSSPEPVPLAIARPEQFHAENTPVIPESSL